MERIWSHIGHMVGDGWRKCPMPGVSGSHFVCAAWVFRYNHPSEPGLKKWCQFGMTRTCNFQVSHRMYPSLGCVPSTGRLEANHPALMGASVGYSSRNICSWRTEIRKSFSVNLGEIEVQEKQIASNTSVLKHLIWSDTSLNPLFIRLPWWRSSLNCIRYVKTPFSKLQQFQRATVGLFLGNYPSTRYITPCSSHKDFSLCSSFESSNFKSLKNANTPTNTSHTIHVCYIYLHLVDFLW